MVQFCQNEKRKQTIRQKAKQNVRSGVRKDSQKTRAKFHGLVRKNGVGHSPENIFPSLGLTSLYSRTVPLTYVKLKLSWVQNYVPSGSERKEDGMMHAGRIGDVAPCEKHANKKGAWKDKHKKRDERLANRQSVLLRDGVGEKHTKKKDARKDKHKQKETKYLLIGNRCFFGMVLVLVQLQLHLLLHLPQVMQLTCVGIDAAMTAAVGALSRNHRPETGTNQTGYATKHVSTHKKKTHKQE